MCHPCDNYEGQDKNVKVEDQPHLMEDKKYEFDIASKCFNCFSLVYRQSVCQPYDIYETLTMKMLEISPNFIVNCCALILC